MKLVTMSGALQEQLIKPSSVFTVPYQISLGGWPFDDAEYHPTEQLTATQILAQSSNIGTIEIAHRLGAQRLSYFLHDLGFGQPSGLGWPGESAGLVPTRTTRAPGRAPRWGLPDRHRRGRDPLQILDAYNAIANGGELFSPRLVEATIGANGSEHVLATADERRVLSPRTVGELLPMLEQVTLDGTALSRPASPATPSPARPGPHRSLAPPGVTSPVPGTRPSSGSLRRRTPLSPRSSCSAVPTSTTEDSCPHRSSPPSCGTRCVDFDIAPTGARGLSSGSSAPGVP